MINGISISPSEEMYAFVIKKLNFFDTVDKEMIDTESPGILSLNIEKEIDNAVSGYIRLELLDNLTGLPLQINLPFFNVYNGYSAKLDKLAWQTYKKYCDPTGWFGKKLYNELRNRGLKKIYIKEPVYRSTDFSVISLEEKHIYKYVKRNNF
ncbi:hypothetical protein [uncultured Lactobacillus sp.]|uniref:hypothetical protein n=1 Tax=uncultured Lactobacillus sp. TaxID=153152 RepID=UPI0023CFF040|nr:hypothetical protein [uncultured Lactobacillus sp.]MDE7056128.1 hypothetical protein [Lactobacillus sp.]